MIKFRVWCKEHNEWESNPTFITDSGTLFCGLVRSAIPLRDDTHIVMQYTGRKDENGKEIYEGDIVRYWSRFIGYELKCVVEFDNELCGFTPFVRHGENISLIYVIGNVYQNPELASKL